MQRMNQKLDASLRFECQPWINKPLGPRLFNWGDTIQVSDYDY